MITAAISIDVHVAGEPLPRVYSAALEGELLSLVGGQWVFA